MKRILQLAILCLLVQACGNSRNFNQQKFTKLKQLKTSTTQMDIAISDGLEPGICSEVHQEASSLDGSANLVLFEVEGLEEPTQNDLRLDFVEAVSEINHEEYACNNTLEINAVNSDRENKSSRMFHAQRNDNPKPKVEWKDKNRTQRFLFVSMILGYVALGFLVLSAITWILGSSVGFVLFFIGLGITLAGLTFLFQTGISYISEKNRIEKPRKHSRRTKARRFLITLDIILAVVFAGILSFIAVAL